MAEPTPHTEGSGQSGPVIRDRRRLDPETGQVRDVYDDAAASPSADGAASPSADAAPATGPATTGPATTGPGSAGPGTTGPATAGPATGPVTTGPGAGPVPGPADGRANGTGSAPAADPAGPEAGSNGGAQVTLDGILADLDTAQASAAERLSDLQRLQAEFVNYRRRVDRDRDVARDQAVAGILEALLPVLDDVHLARQHGDLESGPFAAIAEKLESVLERFGLTRYGQAGEEFDPAVHEALMRTEADLAEGITSTTVVQVLQPGYRSGERVLRAARVAVADPH